MDKQSRRQLTDRYYIIAFNNADAVGGLNDVVGTELLLGAAVERAESLMYQYDVVQVFDKDSGEYRYIQRDIRGYLQMLKEDAWDFEEVVRRPIALDDVACMHNRYNEVVRILSVRPPVDLIKGGLTHGPSNNFYDPGETIIPIERLKGLIESELDDMCVKGEGDHTPYYAVEIPDVFHEGVDKSLWDQMNEDLDKRIASRKYLRDKYDEHSKDEGV